MAASRGVSPESRVTRIRGHALIRRNKRQLHKFPLCARHLLKGKVEPAVEVDHVVPLFKGGTEHESNLQSLCGPCHRDKTNEDLGVRPRVGDDGWPMAVAT